MGSHSKLKCQQAFIWGGDSPVEFDDMMRPLVVDVGCGFGVSLLGLAALECLQSEGSDSIMEKRGYNYLGCDLSSHCISYASGEKMMAAHPSRSIIAYVVLCYHRNSTAVEYSKSLSLLCGTC